MTISTEREAELRAIAGTPEDPWGRVRDALALVDEARTVVAQLRADLSRACDDTERMVDYETQARRRCAELEDELDAT